MGANDRPLVRPLNEYFYSVCVNTVLFATQRPEDWLSVMEGAKHLLCVEWVS